MSRLLVSRLVVLVLLAWLPAAALAQGSPAQEPVTRALTITAEQNWQEDVFFYIFAAATVASALGVVLSGSVVRMAVCLFATFGAVAMLFFLLQAYFLGTAQLIVYVGGILVLIVFGIMLTSSSPWLKFEVKRGELIASGLVCAGLCAGLCFVFLRTNWNGTPQTKHFEVSALGENLLQEYLVPFEVASVLLLVVMIGAAFLARQDQD
ncbi:MAG: NADH-quinone oxidoreductase subunit J [Planctomycetes bacterium]|nr:NADH-quinone oxidoreductase subunit J [Planctomycetota bacterium]